MRLTNAIRDDFVDGVIHARPWTNTMTDKEVLAEFTRRCLAAMPADVRAVHKKYPGLIHMTSVKIEDMPTYAAVLVKGTNSSRYWWAHCPTAIVGLDAKINKGFDDIRKLVVARDDEARQRDEYRTQLQGVAYSCNTLKELSEALPDLVSYMPAPVTKFRGFPVAPVGLIDNLKKAGLKVPKKVKVAA